MSISHRMCSEKLCVLKLVLHLVDLSSELAHRGGNLHDYLLKLAEFAVHQLHDLVCVFNCVWLISQLQWALYLIVATSRWTVFGQPLQYFRAMAHAGPRVRVDPTLFETCEHVHVTEDLLSWFRLFMARQIESVHHWKLVFVHVQSCTSA